MNKYILSLLLITSFITIPAHGAFWASKFKNLSCAKKFGLLGLTGGAAAFAYIKAYPASQDGKGITVRTNDYGDSIYGMHCHLWADHGSQAIGEAEITDSCLVFELSLKDKENTRNFFKRGLFNAVLKCASDRKCKTISNHGADPKLYAELKAYAEANPLPTVK